MLEFKNTEFFKIDSVLPELIDWIFGLNEEFIVRSMLSIFLQEFFLIHTEILIELTLIRTERALMSLVVMEPSLVINNSSDLC